MGGAGTAPREQKELRKTKRGRLGWKQGQGELLGHAGTGLGVRAPEGPSRPEEKDGGQRTSSKRISLCMCSLNAHGTGRQSIWALHNN